MKNNENNMEKNQKEATNIICNVIDKGANYVIKAMPVNEHIKEILTEIKNSVKESDFFNIVSTALTSSVKDGVEINGNKVDLSKMSNFIETAFAGGLTGAINLGIDVVGNLKKYGNLFYNYIGDFFDKLKIYIMSPEFKKKVYAAIEKCMEKIDSFKELCNDWYDAYDKFDMNEIKGIASQLDKYKRKVSFDNACLNENSIIQNVTELVSMNKKKLTKDQFDIMMDLEEI